MASTIAAAAPHNSGTAIPAQILVAEDDPATRLLLAAALEKDFSVVEASDGLAALQVLDSQAIDLAIIDLDLPKLDGFTVIERMRARPATRRLPVIVVTGREDVIAIERAFALGATSFLCKPIGWNIFRHQVGYVLHAARTERAARAAQGQAERIGAFRERSMAVLDKAIRAALTPADAHSHGGAAAQDFDASRDGARLLGVLDRLRRTADILTGEALIEPRPLAAADLAKAAVASVDSASGRAAAERILVSGALALEIACDPALAALALAEVLDNALLYSAPDQPVRLAVVDAPPDRVRFEIDDHGPGIPEYLLDIGLDAFGPRQDAAGSGRRLGLGLPLARAIVEQHGGHFGIVSTPGSGTEVFLSFPSAYKLDRGEAPMTRAGGILPKSVAKVEGGSAS